MIKVHKYLKEISKEHWNRLNTSKNPFTSYEFFYSLEQSKCLDEESGWQARYFVSDKSIAFIFIKFHSYGEYTFDWQWANAYEQNGLDYYPKITSMVPLSPVTTNHFLGEYSQELFEEIKNFYDNHNISSYHYLYLDKGEDKLFKNQDCLFRTNIQYHFFNKSYKSFDDFLDTIKSKKKKQIKKERSFSNKIKINNYTNSDLTQEMASRMYDFYKSTTSEKRSIQYLKKDFFINIFNSLKENILYIEASENDEVIAGSLFLYNNDKLFGRYWGCTKEVKNLHFELCYYQGIDFCIEKNIKIFEAGAQGEHKIKRGFTPIEVTSAHNFKNESFKSAIKNYISEETLMHKRAINQLKESLPFKLDLES